MEVMLALFVFAAVGTALASAMNSIGRIATDIRKEMVLTRILDSELREAMSIPELEEGSFEESLEEGKIDIVVAGKDGAASTTRTVTFKICRL